MKSDFERAVDYLRDHVEEGDPDGVHRQRIRESLGEERVKEIMAEVDKVLADGPPSVRHPVSSRNILLGKLMELSADSYSGYVIWRCPRGDEPEHWHWRPVDLKAIPEPSCEGVESISHSDHHGE